MPLPTTAGVVEASAAAGGVAEDVHRLRKLAQLLSVPAALRKPALRKAGALGMALGAIEGAAKSIKDMDNGERGRFMEMTFGRQPEGVLETLGMDTVRVLGNVGNGIAYDVPQTLGEKLSRFLSDPTQGGQYRAPF